MGKRLAMPVKKTYHHGNLRAALIQAGLELIAQKGVRGLTLREIGAHVGVSRMAAYRHFTDKANLLAAIREAGFEEFAAALESGRDAAGPESLARIRGMGVAYVLFARRHPAYFEVMFGSTPEEGDAQPCEAEKRAFQILESAIAEGQSKGALRKGNTRLMASAAWSIVHGISALKLEQMPLAEGMAPAEFVKACSDLLIGGLASNPKK
jgi:AcrR family transcriptional regulator